MSYHKPDRELATCSDCRTQFDRSVQYYYGAKCPDCVDDEHLKRSCAICGDREMPGDLRGAMWRGRRGSERVQVCSEGCKAHAETKPWSPKPIRLLKSENKFASDVQE